MRKTSKTGAKLCDTQRKHAMIQRRRKIYAMIYGRKKYMVRSEVQ